MFEDLMTTIKAQLYERATSPLIGSFCISWLLINWRFVFTLLSDGSRLEKLNYIETTLYPTLPDQIFFWAAYPIISVIFINFVLPWPSRLLYAHARAQHVKLKKIQVELEEDTPITKAEANKIRRSAMESVIESEKVQERLRTEIGTLKELIHELENNKSVEDLDPSKKTSINSLFKEISDLRQQNSDLSAKLKEAYSQQPSQTAPSANSLALAAMEAVNSQSTK